MISSLKIASRVLLLGAIAILGMSLMVGLYWQQAATQERFRVEADQLANLRNSIGDIGDLVVDAASQADRFLASPKPEMLDAFSSTITRAEELLLASEGDLARLGINGSDGLKSSISQLAVTFEAMYQARELLGFGPDQGLQGSMQSAVAKVESLTDAAENGELRLSMAKLRQHEKDFMLWNSPAVIDAFNTELEAFKAHLKKAYPPGAERMRVAQALDKYVVSFRLYADGSQKLALSSDDMMTVKLQSQAAMDMVQAGLAEQLNVAQTTSEAVREETGRNVAGLMLVAALAMITGVWLIGRSITKPINVIIKAMGTLARGETNVTIAYLNQGNELGEMARAIEVFRQSAIERNRLEQEAEEARSQARIEQETIRREAEKNAQQKLQEATAGIAEGLLRLADGDLTVALKDAFSPEFERLRESLNQTIVRLSALLHEINFASRLIDDGARQINDETKNLADRTAAQAAVLEQTTAALDEIADHIKRSAEQSHDARAAVMKVTGSMGHTEALVENAVAAMSRIENSSLSISSIIGVIDEIAFQTNLLALNAGVEAARAGEAGRGFAVVAHEVRELAQRSASAAKDIKRLIDTSGQEVADGARFVRDTGAALNDIGDQVQIIAAHMETIAIAADEQRETIAEVNAAVAGLDQVTQQNAALVDSNKAEAERLEEQAARLNGLVKTFRLPTSGDFSTETRQRVALSA
ncbi:MAG: methyl-accepting chemotaxis protein [Rhizobium sp.]|nr:methyl-accepting chemotaxis protein [Rhizobium sp.]